MISAPSNHNPNFAQAVRQTQANGTLASSKTILIVNLVTMLTAAELIIPLHDNAGRLLAWMALLSFFSVLRFLLAKVLLKKQLASRQPEDVIKIMSVAAFFQGLSWSLLPNVFFHLDMLGSDAPVMLILIGLAGAAMLRQSFTSQTAFSFTTPILLACAWNFLQHGGVVAIISTLDLILLASFLLYLMAKAEQRAVEGEIAKFTRDHATQSLIIANEDIRQNNMRLEILANCDPVTGLFNRIYLNGKISGALAAATVSEQKVALLLFDVDRFKRINDAFGHHGGDQFLTIVGQRLKNAAGLDATTARISGDEFAVLITTDDVRQKSIALVQAMVECDLPPITINGTSLVPNLSAGLVFFPSGGITADEIFSSASLALLHAKQTGRKQWREFDPKFKQITDRQRQIEQDLKDAIQNEVITAWFQPQMDLKSGAVVSFEALVRWLHPRFGYISPPEIINAAQATNLSQALTVLIARNVCALLKALPDRDFSAATVALNISPREFAIYNVAKMLDDVTAAHGINRQRIEVEITEEAILDPDIAGEQLRQMETSGYKLALDDFGIGYSSLAYLISLNIGRLKIDRSIITNISESSVNQALVAAMVGFGRALDVEIVVEGVETADDVKALTAMGCDVAQGFYYARPMPADALMDWLQQASNLAQNDSAHRASA
ncbi:putative bifunctional diguanylate cyclase/phosphodiesterase [Rhizobium oryziradicis]|uniref:putative bifunctional diguanylate cyclase/phosphodiesterase n=1 Tax=Rhizobium oryziradicis TaxID=1867956 RepID=UPI0009FB6F07|nr:EAL domain-containing protein [Rhizobium oryziradicis]